MDFVPAEAKIREPVGRNDVIAASCEALVPSRVCASETTASETRPACGAEKRITRKIRTEISVASKQVKLL